MDRIISFSLDNKIFIGLMTLILIGWGIWSATKLPVDAVPDITNNQVQIITVCPTLAGQEVEQLVTYPIEQSIATLPDISEIRSISRFGLSVITVVFDEKVNVYFARQLIGERLKEAESKIPNGAGTPEMAPVSTGLGEVYQYIIHPAKGSENKYNAMDLRTMQDWIVARQLAGTPGIAEVNSFGGNVKQYEVVINPHRLLSMDVSVSDIFIALGKNNENTGAAYIDKKPNAYFIRGVGLLSSFEDIRNIVVKSNSNGKPILIRDVAEVQFGSAVRYGAMTWNGEKDAVGGVVMMLKGANSAEVVNRIKEKLPTIQKSLPADVLIEPYLDRTELVNRAITTVQTNLAEGALIVVFVLVLFLGNIRAGLIVASAIPLSMLFALGMMNLFGVSANLMSLGAIDFGLIVDGAVIIVENIFHRITTSKGHSGQTSLTSAQMNETVHKSAGRMMNSAAFGQLIILIVYLPILTLTGIEGKMFGPMAQTVSFAILGAFLLSITYIPVASALFLSKKIGHKTNISDKMMRMLQDKYSLLLDQAIRFKKGVIVISVFLVLGSLVIFSRMGGEFIPTLTEGDFAFHCVLPQGTSLSQSIETSMQASRIAKEFDEVKMVVGKTGAGEVPTDPMPPEATDLMIILKPKDDWKRDISYDELADEITEKLESIPGVFFEKNQPIQMRFNELMTGIRQDVAVKIFGENLDTLIAYADKVAEVVKSVKGTTEPMVERVKGLPQIVIRYNRTQIANYGLNIEDVNHVVSTAFAGGSAGVIFENERRFDLVVRLDSSHRSDINDLENFYIPIPGGKQIPLFQIAEIKMEMGPAQISRDDGKRRVVIGFNVKDRDVESVVSDIEQSLNEKIKLPEGYYYTYGGTFENLQAASKRLMFAVPVALFLILLLLFFAFHSVKQAFLVFTAIPMAAIGGVFALVLRDMPFSISAGIGFITLFGVAVLNGIVLIGTFNQLLKDGVDNVFDRIKEGTKIRLRPVLMTAVVASLGFLPMALSTGAGAEVQKPLATVVIGGLVSATVLTLFVLPLLYIIISKQRLLKLKPKVVMPFLLLLVAGSVKAQTPQTLSLDEAIEIALERNQELQSRQLEVQAAQSMKGSLFELPKTSINLQTGKFNSIEKDVSLQISQTIPFPLYFWSKSNLLDAEFQSGEFKFQVSSNGIKTRVRSLFYQHSYLGKQKRVLLQLDSIYSGFIKAADLGYKTGNTGLLEKTTFETRMGQVRIQLEQVENGLKITRNELKVVLNSETDFAIENPPELQIEDKIEVEGNEISMHPALGLLLSKVEVARQLKMVELTQNLPEFSIGYVNQTMIGFQTVNSNEVYFGKRDRFQSFSAGINIPLSVFSSFEKVNAMDYQQKALEKEAEAGKLALKAELQNEIENYSLYSSQVSFYETTSLRNASLIENTAAVSYKSGEIGYNEFILAVETAAEIRLAFLYSINQRDQSLIKIKSILNK